MCFFQVNIFVIPHNYGNIYSRTNYDLSSIFILKFFNVLKKTFISSRKQIYYTFRYICQLSQFISYHIIHTIQINTMSLHSFNYYIHRQIYILHILFNRIKLYLIFDLILNILPVTCLYLLNALFYYNFNHRKYFLILI